MSRTGGRIPRLPAEGLDGHVLALRFMLWRLDDMEWAGAPVDEGLEEPQCPATADDVPVLLAALGNLVIAAKQEIAAKQLGITDPATVTRVAREVLQAELALLEREARRARLRPMAGAGSGDGQDG